MFDGKRTASLNMPAQLRVDPELKQKIVELAENADRELRQQILHSVKLGVAVESKTPAVVIEPEPMEAERPPFSVELNDEQERFVRQQAERDFRSCADQIRWIVELEMRKAKPSGQKQEARPTLISARSEVHQSRRNGGAL